jgi:hypothetical protein
MSLDPRGSERRGRSRSPGRERERSSTRIEPERERSRVRAPSPPSSRYDDDRYEYEETEVRRKSTRAPEAEVVTAEPRGYRSYRDEPPEDPYAMPGGFEERKDSVKVSYGAGRGEREKDYYAEAGYGRKDEYGRPPPEHERSRYTETSETYSKYADPRDPRRYEDDRNGRERTASFNVKTGRETISGSITTGKGSPGSKYVVPVSPKPKYAAPASPPSKYARPASPISKYAAPESPPSRHASFAEPKYADPKQWEYAQPEEKISYTRQKVTEYGRPEEPAYAAPSGRSRHESTAEYRGESARSSKSTVVTVEPGSRNRRDASPGPGLQPRMQSLSLSAGSHSASSLSLANAPGSPLLESYHGTYQSISPMPSPLMIANHSHTDMNIIEALSPLNSDDERGGVGRKKSTTRRTARFHDPEEEATILAKALKGEKRAPDTGPLVEILPGLTHEQILELRVEYKKLVKTGSDRKGVNIAKHIKMRLKEEDPSLMKACYACALGKWESEAYWANLWYQSEKSHRELLIESLMGRSNREIAEIKDGFSDKKYHDSLSKCMKMELKEDKFKKAILLVLEERRMEEGRVDRRLVEDDVHDLHKAVRAEKGGESAMIGIIVVRSDGHMREVLRAYEATYRSNFAREMLKKSGNLVVRLLSFLPSCLPFFTITNTNLSGRAPSPHPQRHNQQARPRRPLNPPRPLPLQIRQSPHRTPHLQTREIPLG